MRNRSYSYLKLIGLLFCIFNINCVFAQSFYREYSDAYTYMYIDNYEHQYWTGSPKLPNHRLVIKNISNKNINVRVLLHVVLRNGNGTFLKDETVEKNLSIAPGGTKTATSWMSTANKGNAYYCVEGFKVLNVITQGNSQYGTQHNSHYYVVKNTAGAYYYDFTNKLFICNGTWNKGSTIYLTGKSYDFNGMKLLETTAKTDDKSSYWYIPNFAFQNY